MVFRKTCAAVSAPRLDPQPNCVPWKSIRRWSVAKELTHFEHTRRSVFPTKIGRTAPSFFRRPISVAPKKKVSTLQGLCPLRQYLVRFSIVFTQMAENHRDCAFSWRTARGNHIPRRNLWCLSKTQDSTHGNFPKPTSNKLQNLLIVFTSRKT